MQGTSRVLPAPPLPLPTGWWKEGRPGLYGAECMKKSKPQQALLCQASKGVVALQGLWSWGKHRREKGTTHRCKDIQCKCVDMDILCMHKHTLIHTHALSYEEHEVLFTLMPICVCTWGEVTWSLSIMFHHESHWRLDWIYHCWTLIEFAVVFAKLSTTPNHAVFLKEHLSSHWKIPRVCQDPLTRHYQNGIMFSPIYTAKMVVRIICSC